MSNFINKEKLTAGTIFADLTNDEYIYMPGSEIGTSSPMCILKKRDQQIELSLDDASAKIQILNLKPLNIKPFSKI